MKINKLIFIISKTFKAIYISYEWRFFLVFDFFCAGVFQGTKTASYNVDKKPPMAPVFTSSAETFYARDKVTVQVSAEENDTIFVAVSEPFKITEEKAEGGSDAHGPVAFTGGCQFADL